MSLKNEIPKELVLVSYLNYTNSNTDNKYTNTILGIFDSKDDLIEILNNNQLKSYFGNLSVDELVKSLKIEKVNYFRSIKTYRKELLNDLLS